MEPVNFRSFRKKLSLYRSIYRKFLNKTEKNPPQGIEAYNATIQPHVWAQVDCLSCANCCKTMTPTFTEKDIKRISAYFHQSPQAFTNQWLKKDRNKDMVNKSQPCQFLNLQTNMCSIYSVRPADCAGFPHLAKRKWSEYAYIHKQNIDYCPATLKMVEKMVERFG